MSTTGIIILAAGNSSRLGRPKQLLPWKGKPLVAHVASEALAAGLSPVVVVTGAYGNEVEDALWGMEVRLAHNDWWEDGMASSIVIGLEAMSAVGGTAGVMTGEAGEADEVGATDAVEAVIIAVCDQPFINASVFSALMDRRVETGLAVVASVYGDSVGTPVLFAAELFPELMELKGDMGAKKILSRHEYATVGFPGGSFDVDTEEGAAAMEALDPGSED